MRGILQALWLGVLYGLRTVFKQLWDTIIHWPKRLVNLIRDLCTLCREGKRRRGDCCVHAPPDTEVRADPLIYCQSFLMDQGMGVTWDNPDIDLFDHTGALVGANAVAVDSDYSVRVRIWNGSFAGPAPHTVVRLSYLSFGINTKSEEIAASELTVPTRGAPGHPVMTVFQWHTPPTPGHYCLQAKIEYELDMIPNNNLGQKNLNLGKLQSPVEFEFPVRNEFNYRRHFVLEADTYSLSALAPCDVMPKPSQFSSRLDEALQRWRTARAEHAREKYPIPPGWSVEFEPGADLDFAPNESKLIRVRISPPPGYSAGAMKFNVNALENGRLIGGVTLVVVKA